MNILKCIEGLLKLYHAEADSNVMKPFFQQKKKKML